MRLFTTTEAAEYLRLKERKLYELVAEDAIPCTKVTGKWLFPQSELDRWLAANLTRPKGMQAGVLGEDSASGEESRGLVAMRRRLVAIERPLLRRGNRRIVAAQPASVTLAATSP